MACGKLLSRKFTRKSLNNTVTESRNNNLVTTGKITSHLLKLRFNRAQSAPHFVPNSLFTCCTIVGIMRSITRATAIATRSACVSFALLATLWALAALTGA